MSRAFFTEVEDALAGFLPPALRDFRARTSPRNLKVWFGDEGHEHYEVQLIAASVVRAAGLKLRGAALEIGLHAEHPLEARNDELLARFEKREKTLRRALGKEPVIGSFVGRQRTWRRVSELWHDVDMMSSGVAVDASERLARYICTLEPLRSSGILPA